MFRKAPVPPHPPALPNMIGGHGKSNAVSIISMRAV